MPAKTPSTPRPKAPPTARSTSPVRSDAAWTLNLGPVRPADRDAIDVDLLLSTPKTVVVRVQAIDEEGRAREDALVIRRQDCVGDRPLWRALLEAAAERVGRSTSRIIRRVMVWAHGAWHVLHEQGGGSHRPPVPAPLPLRSARHRV